MMVVFVVKITCPDLQMAHELLPNFSVLIIDEGSKIIDIIAGLIEILYRYWIRISKANKILKNKCVVLPKPTPKDGSQSI